MAVLKNSYAKNATGAMVQTLLDGGANVNSPPSKKHTSALQAAIDSGNFEFVDRLLDLGADVNAHDPRFGTALSAAARWDRVELMKKLVAKGADVTLAGQKWGYISLLSCSIPKLF
jgi:ankyrin repeat protein